MNLTTSFPSENILNDIRDKMNQKSIVPVIGFNAYCVKGSKQSALSYLMQHFLISWQERLGLSDAEIKDYSLACDDVIKGLNKINMLFKSKNWKMQPQLKSFMRDNKEILSMITLQEDVRNYLTCGDFPLIISTSFLNIPLSTYEETYYSKDADGDLIVDMKGNCAPTIYYLFGRIDNYGLFSETDFISYLHCLHDSNMRPGKMLAYLSKRYIMLIGCGIPDWTFRFLLYSLKPNSIERPELLNGTFEGGAINQNMEDDLSLFLQEINYLVGDDLKKFLVQLVEKTPKKPTLFLSYSAEEGDPIYTSILEIKEQLSSRFDVWFYPSQKNANAPGTAYWELIEEGIKSCTYFMPIISSDLYYRLLMAENKIKLHLDTTEILKDEEWGILSEWKLALRHYHELKKEDSTTRYCLPCLVGVKTENAKDLINGHLCAVRELLLPPNGCNFAEYKSNKSLEVESIFNNLVNH